MKFLFVVCLTLLSSLVSSVSSANLGKAEDGFLEDGALAEKVYQMLLQNAVDTDLEEDTNVKESWGGFKKAFSDAAKWTSNAAKDVGNAVKTGCHYVNQAPFRDFVLRAKELNGMAEEDVDEEFLSGALAAYNGAKQACRHVG